MLSRDYFRMYLNRLSASQALKNSDYVQFQDQPGLITFGYRKHLDNILRAFESPILLSCRTYKNISGKHWNRRGNPVPPGYSVPHHFRHIARYILFNRKFNKFFFFVWATINRIPSMFRDSNYFQLVVNKFLRINKQSHKCYFPDSRQCKSIPVCSITLLVNYTGNV